MTNIQCLPYLIPNPCSIRHFLTGAANRFGQSPSLVRHLPIAFARAYPEVQWACAADMPTVRDRAAATEQDREAAGGLVPERSAAKRPTGFQKAPIV